MTITQEFPFILAFDFIAMGRVRFQECRLLYLAPSIATHPGLL